MVVVLHMALLVPLGSLEDSLGSQMLIPGRMDLNIETVHSRRHQLEERADTSVANPDPTSIPADRVLEVQADSCTDSGTSVRLQIRDLVVAGTMLWSR